jgi:nucleoside-diphosphate-sugar epimerase
MKILITGATGFVGTVLSKKLRSRGDEVIALVRKTSNISELEKAKVELSYGDVTDYESLLKSSKDVDTIVHIAAVIHPVNVDESFYYKANTEGTRNVAKAALANNVKHVIYTSSVTAYGEIRNESKEITEDTECVNQGIYGKSKYQGELALKEELEGKIPYTIFRIARVMGEGDKSLVIVAKLLKKSIFPVIGNGMTTMMPIHVEDVGGAIILALDKKESYNQIYNLTGGELYTKKQFLNEMAEKLNVRKPWLFIPVPLMTFFAIICEKLFLTFSKEPPLSRKKIKFFILNRRYSSKKLQEQLGFKYEHSMSQIIAEMIEWYKENQWV